jgi:hypothetical protein
VISSNGGSCGDVGRKFFVMTSNVGMTAKLIPQVLLSEPMLELKKCMAISIMATTMLPSFDAE